MNTRLQVQRKTTPKSSFIPVRSNLLPERSPEHAEPLLVPSILHEVLPNFQAKLTIGQPNDQYEQEADRVAEQVMRMPEPKIQRVCPECEEELQRQPMDEEEEEEETLQTKPLAEQITPLVQRETEPMEEDEEEETLQTKTTSGQTPTVSSSLQNQINALRGGGQPLPQTERAFFEPRFGSDFSQVRVHADSQAAETASAVNARAFTIGQDVVFGKGQYQPRASEGQRLLAHELTHVVQQKSAEMKIQRHGNHAALATPMDRYRHTLQHAGTNQSAWERGLRNNATFLGIRISGGIHQELLDRLSNSESYLKNRPVNRSLSDAQIAQRIGLYSLSGRRNPANAIGGRRISYHAFGLAIDVNYRGNPYIARHGNIVAQIIQRATTLILGRPINIQAVSRDLILEQLRDLYQEASDALKTYFSFRNNRDALVTHLRSRALPAGDADVTDWLQRIRADYNNQTLRNEFRMTGGQVRDPAQGFIDLSEELVLALSRFSGLVPEQGLTWGGDPGVYAAGRDMMHFDWRNGTVKNYHRI